ILKDKLTTPRGRSLVRVIQASLQQHKVTVSAGGNVIARSLAFAAVTPYQTVATGTWNVRAAGESSNAAQSIKLAAGTIHTLGSGTAGCAPPAGGAQWRCCSAGCSRSGLARAAWLSPAALATQPGRPAGQR